MKKIVLLTIFCMFCLSLIGCSNSPSKTNQTQDNQTQNNQVQNKISLEQAREIAKKAYRALNCKGMTRVDMFATSAHTIVLNEVNTIPGFTATSRYPSSSKKI